MNEEKSDRRAEAMHPLDAMTKSPKHHLVLLENEKVRVLDTRLGPGDQTPVHAHQWPGALYVVSWSDFVRYDPDGKVLVDSRTLPAKPALGTAIWSVPIGPHYVRNVGQTELRIIAVEVKEQATVACVCR
jgi:hypothetical protein